MQTIKPEKCNNDNFGFCESFHSLGVNEICRCPNMSNGRKKTPNAIATGNKQVLTDDLDKKPPAQNQPTKKV
jgi:hypothetical protein